MKISNKLYDILKWVVIIVLPAMATLYKALSAVWAWPYANEVVTTITAVWPAEFNKLFTPKGHTALSAITCFYIYFCLIQKLHCFANLIQIKGLIRPLL